MAVSERWGRALRGALRDYEQRHDTRLSYTEIGRRVGARLNRAPFASQSARAWFVEGQEPESFAVAEAIAYVLEVDPGALAFPKEGSARVDLVAPTEEPETIDIGGLEIERASIVRFSDEELAEARRQLAEMEALELGPARERQRAEEKRLAAEKKASESARKTGGKKKPHR